MRLIKHSEISGRIYTLLDECDEKMIIVSPYVKIAKWYKLVIKLKALKTKNIPLEIYVRDDKRNTATFEDLETLELPYKKIPHLHSKLYMNEKQGILTSMNLLLGSEIKSLEAGCITENQRELNELMAYYRRYIQNAGTHEAMSVQAIADQSAMKNMIENKLQKQGIDSWILYVNQSMEISTNRGYYRVKIFRGYISISLKFKVQDKSWKPAGSNGLSKSVSGIENLSHMKIDARYDPRSTDLFLSAQAQQKIKSKSLTAVLSEELPYLVEDIEQFVVATNEHLH